MNIEQIKTKLKSEEYVFLRTDKNLGKNAIIITLGGSHAYGTNNENSDLDIRGCTLNSKMQILKVTEELLYDNAFGLENYIIRQFSKALANAEEDAFLNGTGTGQPLGLLATEGGAEIGVTAASATEITSDEIIDLVYSLKRPYRKNAKFICNDQTLAAIRKLTDKNGRYLWQDSVQAGEPGRLLGYEVYTSPYFPVITAGMPAIAFGDYSYYNIGDRGTRSFAELKELFAGNGMVGFVAKERVDGKLILSEAVKLLKMNDALQRNVEAVLSGTDGVPLDEIDARLEELQKELLKVANAKGNYDGIVNEIYSLREAKQNAQVACAEREGMKKRISEMQQFLAEQQQDITEYDEQLVRRLIEKITVYDERVTVEFKSGTSVDVKR